MQDNEPSPSDHVEQLLRSFSPAPAGIDRDRLMFLAGRASRDEQLVEDGSAGASPSQVKASPSQARLRSRLWPALSLVTTAAALTLAVMLWQRPERTVFVDRPVVREVVREIASSAPSGDQPSRESLPPNYVAMQWPSSIDPDDNYVIQREKVLRDGVDALDDVEAAGGPARYAPATQRELLQEMYGPKFVEQSGRTGREWWQQWFISADRL